MYWMKFKSIAGIAFPNSLNFWLTKKSIDERLFLLKQKRESLQKSLTKKSIDERLLKRLPFFASTHWLIRNKVFCFDHHWQHKQMSHQKSQFCWTWSVMIYLGLLDNSWVLSGIAIQSNIFEAICLKLLQWFYILATHGPFVIVFFEFVKKLGVHDLNN